MHNINWGVLFLQCSTILGAKSISKITAKFSDNLHDLIKLNGHFLKELHFKNNSIKFFLEYQNKFKPEEIYELCEKHNIKIINSSSENYPKLLREISSPPPYLFLQGELFSNKPPLAVVGSRYTTHYGRSQAKTISAELAHHFHFISGLAFGIDSITHETANNASSPNAAIIACGHLTLSGRQKILATKILQSGGQVISEYLPMTTPQKHFFPIRNRLIAGIAQGTLIIEANQKSGSMITAKFALEQNRDLFALPGPVDSLNSSGTNQLIKQGANLITSAEDIINYYNLGSNQETSPPNLNEIEMKIIDSIKSGNQNIDQISSLTTLDTANLIAILQLLEIKGIIHNSAGHITLRRQPFQI
jgi:DNA processing protein